MHIVSDTYVQFGKVGEDLWQSIMVVLLGEFDFAHIEMSNSVDLIVFVYYSGSFSLGFG